MFSPDSLWVGELGLQTDLVLRRPEGKRVYDVYIPSGLQDNPALIINMHSKGANKAEQRERSGLDRLADERRDFIIV